MVLLFCLLIYKLRGCLCGCILLLFLFQPHVAEVYEDVEKFQIVRRTGEMLPKYLRTGTPPGRDNLVVSEHSFMIFVFVFLDIWDNLIPIYLVSERQGWRY